MNRSLLVLTALLALAGGVLAAPAQAAARADLTVAVVRTIAFPAAPAAGGRVSVAASVKNIGTLDAKSTKTGLVLSRDTKYTISGDRLLQDRTQGILRKGKASSVTFDTVLPTMSAATTYYLLVCADRTKLLTESNESNCRIWKTFKTAPATPPVTTGPVGGATSVCSGTEVRRPFPNLSTPQPGVRFAVTPGPDGKVRFAARAVGVEWDYLNESLPPYRLVTITNTGTATATGIGEVEAYPCQLDSTKPDFWGSLVPTPYLGSNAELGIDQPCGSTLAAGASCEIAIGTTDPVARGGTDLPGFIRIPQNNDYVAYFPVFTGSTSQGYWRIEPYDGSSGDLSNGQRRPAFYLVTNVGDRDAVPTFSVEGANEALWTRIEASSWTLAEMSNPAPAGVSQCQPVTVSPGPGGVQIFAPALSPGSACLLKYSICSSAAGAKTATLRGRASGTAKPDDVAYPLSVNVVGEGTPTCPPPV